MLDKNISKKGHPRNSRRYMYRPGRRNVSNFNPVIPSPPDPLIWTRRHHRRRRRRLLCTYVYKCIKSIQNARVCVYRTKESKQPTAAILKGLPPVRFFFSSFFRVLIQPSITLGRAGWIGGILLAGEHSPPFPRTLNLPTRVSAFTSTPPHHRRHCIGDQKRMFFA